MDLMDAEQVGGSQLAAAEARYQAALARQDRALGSGVLAGRTGFAKPSAGMLRRLRAAR